MNIQELQAAYPDVPQDKLLQDFHAKYYPDVPFNDFALKMGAGPRQDPATKGGDSTAVGLAKATGSGAVKGFLAGTAGLPGDMSQIGGQMVSAITGDPSYAKPEGLAAHGTAFMLKKMAENGLEMHKPQTTGEKYADETAAGAAGMAPGNLRHLLMRMIVGGAAGAGGELGSRLMAPEGEESPIGRLFTSLGIQAIPGYLAGRKPQIVKAVQGDLKDLTPAELRAASDKARAAQDKLGTDVTLPQGFDSPTALSGIQQELVRSSSGDILRRVLDRQLPVGQGQIDLMVAGASPKSIDQKTANQVLAAGDKAIKRPSEVRTRMVDPSYEAAGRESIVPFNPPNTVQGVQAARNGTTYSSTTSVDLDTILSNMAKARDELHLTGTPAGDAMDMYQKRIVEMASKFPDGKIPVLNLDALAKQARKAAQAGDKVGADAATVQNAIGHGTISQVLNEATTSASNNLKQGKDIYGRATAAIVDPVETSALTTMFPKTQRESGKGDWSSFSKVLDDPKFGPRDVTFAAENLKKADPQAFPAIVKQNWMEKAEQARAPVDGRAPQGGLGDFATAVAGAPGSATRDKFRETVRQVSLSAGKSPEEAMLAARGAEELIDALHVVSRDRGGIGQINPEELRRSSGATLPGAGLRAANVVAPTQGLGRALERVVQKRTYEQLANALSSPDGVETLLRIAKWSHPRELALQTIRGIAANNAQAQSAAQFGPDAP
jgi:hypothetical protein